MTDYELLYVIACKNDGSKILHFCRQHGVSGGTILMANGSLKSDLLKALSLCDVKKEVVMMALPTKLCEVLIERLRSKFRFDKPQHGIAYRIALGSVYGSHSCVLNTHNEIKENKTMYQSINIIVDKGQAEDVVDAAVKAGAKGATIINGRGSGLHETSRLFAMDVEPEKELIMIIANSADTDRIVESIRINFAIEKPGNGIVFVQDVINAYGLFD
ncbi:MAG: P-II family nitrogen regulator [Erysipelotrichaceae bacterium]|nr:P-II family nitrogen regulator [Erysipelotrichaceae bacterium]